jgi:hypothetical protein
MDQDMAYTRAGSQGHLELHERQEQAQCNAVRYTVVLRGTTLCVMLCGQVEAFRKDGAPHGHRVLVDGLGLFRMVLSTRK